MRCVERIKPQMLGQAMSLRPDDARMWCAMAQCCSDEQEWDQPFRPLDSKSRSQVMITWTERWRQELLEPREWFLFSQSPMRH